MALLNGCSAASGDQRQVSDPLGRPVEARWLVLDDGTAVVEAAEAIGLGRVAPEERDPLARDEPRSGRAAASRRSRTAPTDCSSASAARRPSTAVPACSSCSAAFPSRSRVACDVRSPLLGPRGAARAYGPQKGADAAAVASSRRGSRARADLAPFALLPGAGAAGGLGAALAALGGELVPGRGARSRPDRLRRSARRRRPRRDRRGHGRHDHVRGQGAGRRRSPPRATQACGASCSAAWSSVSRGRGGAGAQRRPCAGARRPGRARARWV